LHGTTLEHGSIFTSGPTPENPPKRYFVENVQMNYLLADCAAYIPATEFGGFTPRFGKRAIMVF
jgi:hypothetical protein